MRVSLRDACQGVDERSGVFNARILATLAFPVTQAIDFVGIDLVVTKTTDSCSWVNDWSNLPGKSFTTC